MKRDLTNEERRATENAVKLENGRIKQLEEGIWYIDETSKNQKIIWEYEDKTRDYKRRVEIDKFDEVKKKMIPELEWSKNSIKIAQEQLEYGVEVKDKKQKEEKDE